MRKRIVATVLALCLVLGLVPGTAWAADVPTSGTCGKNATWSLSGGTLTISGSGPMDNYALDNYDSLAPWDNQRKSITSVVIDNGITSIGDYAFRECDSLTSANIPDSVISIGFSAFTNCSNLTSITIPDSVSSIGNNSLTGRRRLTNITIAYSVT